MATSKTAKAPVKKAETKQVFSDVELEAMQAARNERRKGSKADGEADLKAAIEKLEGLDRTIAEGLHRIVTANAPSLLPKTWYGMPAWANADGKAVCFFQAASKFKARYGTFGFNPEARLDDGNIWATSFALLKLGADEEAQITALLRKAVG
ncbi:MAG: hypothetical protein J0I99_13920 [Devosia sp.]|uniref:hypothetical protein n=1 Tax=Devosia sp. TaxID=1871048 RepID=UPI001AC7AEE1|nr:hypothetical protein [Devosia sp.]MBN9316834.1 hypothetical protein [Devosia sp.]